MSVSKFGRDNVGYLFILPAMALFLLFVFYPMIYIVQAGFYEWDGVNERVFIGLRNYMEMFTNDRIFSVSLRNSFYWIFLTIFPQMFLGFFLAYILNHHLWGHNAARAIFYMPAVMSAVVIGIIWQRIYNPFGGLLSDVGRATGLKFLVQPYIADPRQAIFSAIGVNVWQWTGFSLLMYLAGLQGITAEILESAEIEGASKFRQVRHIIWPMCRNTHLTLILLGVIGALQTFDLIYALTNGGPNNASQMLPTYIYKKAFALQHMGYGSAISVVTMCISLVLSLFQTQVLGSRFSLKQ